MGKEPRDRSGHREWERKDDSGAVEKRHPTNDDGNKVTDWDKPQRPQRDEEKEK